MSDACANPDCGHRRDSHGNGWDTMRCFVKRCSCPAFVADVNRPDDHQHDGTLPAEFCEDCAAALAAVPDREGATEQLAAILGRHRHHPPMQTHGGYMENGCSCGVVLDRPDTAGDWAQAALIHDTHLAAVIVAAGWRKV